MPRLPKFVSFLLKFLGSYFVLVLLLNLTGMRDGLTSAFAKWASGSYKNHIPQAEASFQPSDELGEHDLNVIFVNTKTREEKFAEARRTGQQNVNLDISASPFSVWDYWILPFIVLISLVIAMPGRWKRKGQALLLGGFVLWLFTWLRFRGTLVYLAKESANLEPLGIGSFYDSFLNGMQQMQSIEFIFISTILIWGLTALRREDFSVLLGRKGW